MAYGFILSDLNGVNCIEVPPKSPIPTRYKLNPLPPVLDQGHEPWCVPYSFQTVMTYKGISCPSPYNMFTGNSSGMMIRDLLDQQSGLFYDYAYCNSLEAIKHCLIQHGPIMVGALVRGSYRPDFWNGKGDEGGHCFCVVGYDEHHLIIQNSWGTNYGQEGYYKMRNEDVDKILEAWVVIT